VPLPVVQPFATNQEAKTRWRCSSWAGLALNPPSPPVPVVGVDDAPGGKPEGMTELGTGGPGRSRRQFITLVMAVMLPVTLVPSLVVGVLTRSVGWGLLTCLLTGVLSVLGCVVTLGALKDWPLARPVFKLVFGPRQLARLLFLGPPPRH
jgi:hypothetical protein